MAKTIKIHKDSETDDFYLLLADFADFLDITKVEYYKIKQADNGALIFEFFDKDDCQIKIKTI
jgi:hypothetical protein